MRTDNLLERCRLGEEEAFDELVLKYQKKIFNAAYRILGNYEDAADVSQETFIRAYKGLKRFRGECSLSTWLHQILFNLCKTRLRILKKNRSMEACLLNDPIRSNGEELPREIASSNTTPDLEVEQGELQASIQRAIDSLPEEHRAAVILRHIGGFSYEEIGVITNSSLEAIKSRLHRARLLLREELKEWI
ncbi:TPA: RNA polymerase subunit sigma-24 [bacterium]|nr:RNA polymerase subunit sigma-24 [bacterium]